MLDEIGLFDAENFPQRAADYDFTIRANRLGFQLYCNCDAKLYSYKKHTTGSIYTHKFSFNNYYKHLTTINGGANIVFIWRYAMKNCPRKYRFKYITITLMKCFIGYPAIFLMPKIRQILMKIKSII